MSDFSFIIEAHGVEKKITVQADTEAEAILLARCELFEFEKEVLKDEDLR